MNDGEQWEEEYECISNRDFARLIDLRTRDFKKDKTNFDLKIRLCEAYYLNEEYKRAFAGYSKLYNEDSENYVVIYGLLDCLKKLKIDINDFKWRKKPEILTVEEGLEESYMFMKRKRKPRSVTELYLRLYGRVYLDFTEKELLARLLKDQRFILAGEIDGVFSRFKRRAE